MMKHQTSSDLRGASPILARMSQLWEQEVAGHIVSTSGKIQTFESVFVVCRVQRIAPGPYSVSLPYSWRQYLSLSSELMASKL